MIDRWQREIGKEEIRLAGPGNWCWKVAGNQIKEVEQG